MARRWFVDADLSLPCRNLSPTSTPLEYNIINRNIGNGIEASPRYHLLAISKF